MYMGQFLGTCSDETVVSVLTPWMSRQADNMWVTLEQVIKVGAPTLSLKIHKKAASSTPRDGGSGTTVSLTSTNVGNSVFHTARLATLDEMLRFEIILTGSSSEPVVPESVIFRFHEPTWYNTTAA